MFKMLRILLAVTLLAAIALPAAAQTQKLQTVSMSGIGSDLKATVTWVNSSPPGGNSQLSSARIDLSAAAQAAGWKFDTSPGAVTGPGQIAVTLTSITFQKMSPIKPQKSFTVTFKLQASGLECGEPPQAIIFTGFTGSSLSGDNFFDQPTFAQTPTPYTVINASYSCVPNVGCTGVPFIDDGVLKATRLPDKDGNGVCAPTDVFVTVDAANKTVSINSSNPVALFEATVKWPPEFVDATGMPRATRVSWDGTNFADGRACIADVPLTEYATLALGIPAGPTAPGTTTITTTVPAPVFLAGTPTSTNKVPIVVDSERMNVIGQSGTILTVERFAGTNGTGQVSHNAGTKVMSTPFPLDGSSSTSKVMLVCIVAESFATAPAEACSPATPAQACVKVETTVLGDLYVSRN